MKKPSQIAIITPPKKAISINIVIALESTSEKGKLACAVGVISNNVVNNSPNFANKLFILFLDRKSVV